VGLGVPLLVAVIIGVLLALGLLALPKGAAAAAAQPDAKPAEPPAAAAGGELSRV
jgi:hypothetical protein